MTMESNNAISTMVLSLANQPAVCTSEQMNKVWADVHSSIPFLKKKTVKACSMADVIVIIKSNSLSYLIG